MSRHAFCVFRDLLVQTVFSTIFFLLDRIYRIPRTVSVECEKRYNSAWDLVGIFPDRRHPFHYHLAVLCRGTLVSSAELAQYVGRRVTMAGWIFAERRQVRHCERCGALRRGAKQSQTGQYLPVYSRLLRFARNDGPKRHNLVIASGAAHSAAERSNLK